MNQKKQPSKLTISLKKEDEANLLQIRSYLETKYCKQYSLADVVRHVCSKALSQDAL